jgi:hypothetical protein
MSTKTRTTETPEQIAPAVHLEFIRNRAELPDDSGLEEIGDYHRALFMHHRAHELARVHQEGMFHEERLGFLHARWKELQERLQKLDKFVPVHFEGEPDLKPSVPWNIWDRVMFFSALCAIVSLLVFGILNISFNLLESGLVTFLQNPMRAYFWAALLPVGAFGVKVGWDLLPNSLFRNGYAWACLALGMAGVLIWVAAYSTVYPTLSKSITDHLETLSVFDGGSSRPNPINPGGARVVDMIMVFAQAIAEIFLSAVLGIYMTLIYNRHRPIRLGTDPVFAQLDEERLRLEREVEEARMGLASARGQETQLENQLAALASFAKSIYQKETASHREQSQQKEALLDQISHHLRTQLEAIPNGATQDRSANLSLSRQNGK